MNLKPTLSNELLAVNVDGDLNSTNAQSLANEIRRLLDTSGAVSPEWNTFRLNLASANMVDSVGLNLIVSLLKQLRKRNAKLQIAYSSHNIFRMLAFTRLDEHVELVKI